MSANSNRIVRTVFLVYIALVLGYVFAPILTMATFSFNDSSLPSFPWRGFTVAWYRELFYDESFRSAFSASVKVAVSVSLLSTAVGLTFVYWLRRSSSGARDLLVALITLPALLPVLMLGLAIFVFFNQLRFLGSIWALALALCTLGIPYAIAVIRAQLADVDVSIEEAAANLGAREWQILLHVTTPVARAGISGAAFLAFVVAWDEFAISWFVTQFSPTLPVKVYESLGSGLSPKINAAGTVFFGVSFVLTGLAYLVVIRPILTRRRAG